MARRKNEPPPLSEDSALAGAGTDLTARAKAGSLRQAFAVDEEVEAIVKALSRSDKASCALIGPAGSGKSAIVEELARRQIRGTLPEGVAQSRIVRISLQELAGLQPPGLDVNNYWSYFKQMLDEATRDSVILFFDEAQALHFWPVSSQTLKPYLARGELRIIAAATLEDFDTFIRGDTALERRFQQVLVREPNEEKLRLILRGVARSLRKQHRVVIEPRTIEECIRLSRYLQQNQPDAAIDLLELAVLEASSKGRMQHEH